MVISAGIPELLILLSNHLADGVGSPEIERCTCNIGDFACRDAERVNRNEVAGSDGHDIVLDSAVGLASEAEERMVGNIDMGLLVGGGKIVDAEFAAGSDCIGHRDVLVARIPFHSVRMEIVEDNAGVRY